MVHGYSFWGRPLCLFWSAVTSVGHALACYAKKLQDFIFLFQGVLIAHVDQFAAKAGLEKQVTGRAGATFSAFVAGNPLKRAHSARKLVDIVLGKLIDRAGGRYGEVF